jgi:hypothetical protein
MSELERTQAALKAACKDIIKRRASEFGTTYDPAQTEKLYEVYLKEVGKDDG